MSSAGEFDDLITSAAIRWARAKTATGTGRPSFSAPAALTCRWKSGAAEFIGGNGDRRQAVATVLVDPDDTLNEGDMLALGTYVASGLGATPADPLTVAGALEVTKVESEPELLGVAFPALAYLGG